MAITELGDVAIARDKDRSKAEWLHFLLNTSQTAHLGPRSTSSEPTCDPGALPDPLPVLDGSLESWVPFDPGAEIEGTEEKDGEGTPMTLSRSKDFGAKAICSLMACIHSFASFSVAASMSMSFCPFPEET